MRFLKQLGRGRIAGHPIHIMLVHFPSALIPFSLILETIGFFSISANYTNAATYALAGAVIFAIMAMIFGAIDFLKISSEDKAWKTASWHAGLNILWLFCWASMLGYKLKSYPHHEPEGVVYLAILGILVTGMIVSNFLGGELVLKHGLGRSGELED